MRISLGITRSHKEPTLAVRLAWVTALRLAFLTILLSATAFFYLSGELHQYPFSLRILLFAIGGAYALAAFYAVLLRRGTQLRQLAFAQILFDQLTWTAIVYVSGGPSSGATSFYALTCLVGASLVGARGAGLGALSGLGLYGVLCGSLHFGWLLPPHDQPEALAALHSAVFTYPILINTLGIVVVALLSAYLADRLSVTGGALVEATLRADRAEHLAELGRIAAWLAHEIRNPLGSITGSIELVRESAALTQEEKQLCNIVRREAVRLNNLVGDMIDYSKPRPPTLEAVDVASLAREVVALAMHSDRTGVTHVPVTYEGPPGCTLARCDGSQIRQVLWNLVRNAVQASQAGGRVTARVSTIEREVILSVEDSGPGIDDATAARIFDAFYTTRSHGTGIGLAVVKRIIDDHATAGARITVEKAPTGGASFRVALSTDVGGLRRSMRPPPLG